MISGSRREGKNRKGLALGAGALALAVGASGVLAWSVLGQKGGASSPEAAAEKFLTSLAAQDVVGVIDSVLPGEVEGLSEAWESSRSEAVAQGEMPEEGVTSAATVTADTFDFTVDEVDSAVALVSLADTDLSVEWDLDKVDGKKLKKEVDELDLDAKDRKGVWPNAEDGGFKELTAGGRRSASPDVGDDRGGRPLVRLRARHHPERRLPGHPPRRRRRHLRPEDPGLGDGGPRPRGDRRQGLPARWSSRSSRPLRPLTSRTPSHCSPQRAGPRAVRRRGATSVDAANESLGDAKGRLGPRHRREEWRPSRPTRVTSREGRPEVGRVHRHLHRRLLRPVRRVLLRRFVLRHHPLRPTAASPPR